MTFTAIDDIEMSVVTKAGEATVQVRDGRLVAEVRRGSLRVELFSIPVLLVEELLAATDAMSVIADFVSLQVEFLLATDSPNSYANYANLPVAESVTALDSEVAGRGLAPRDVPESVTAAETEAAFVNFISGLAVTDTLTPVVLIEEWVDLYDNYTMNGWADDDYFEETGPLLLLINGGADLNVLTLALAVRSDCETVAYEWFIRVTGDVYSTDTANAGLTMGSGWAGGSTFALYNTAVIRGKGGDGGRGGVRPTPPGVIEPGTDGGPAIELSGLTVDITNGAGFILGGGGGGGGGALSGYGGPEHGGGGGGGGGAGEGVGAPQWIIAREGEAGVNGTTTAPGVGGAGGPSFDPGKGGVGGTGGVFGQPGGTGGVGDMVVTFSAPETGGAAGKAINLSGGTANFLSGGSSPNVEGAVS